MKSIRILVLGATGLIGSTLFKALSKNAKLSVFGSVRDSKATLFFPSPLAENLICDVEASSYKKWWSTFKNLKPDIVINCIGVTKHVAGGGDPLVTIPVNSYFPHFLDSLCRTNKVRLIHISSDCVFSGIRGAYLECDIPDATDFYGESKALGELKDGPAVTLRTSTIGHELYSSIGLLDWFLGQKDSCQGYKEAYFSGVTTLELAKIIEQYILPNPELHGLYHVGAHKISKFDLLTQIASIYGKKIEIIPNNTFRIDRSLNSDRFYKATGYTPPSWTQLIKWMRLSK